MHGQPFETPSSKAERIASAYARAAGGDTWAALVQAVADALTDLAEAERRYLRRDWLISRGYVRGAPLEPSERA
ncbi:hypothetical protein [Methylobacterium radiodurans]|uniref:Uncharacterized protein n=1 Tax=Methylobacterium radiodurans TaxID=2202828 RepID=A0A2U8VS59_9HYPH|nr:hypothetical protein [Methylobacterium radiodurans]AWN36537.1 hypothetical protein DK427_13020 [Methylobacterium radiodurans]